MKLEDLSKSLDKILSKCTICPHKCRVNRKIGLTIPTVFNTGGYDNPQIIKMLNGTV